MSGFFTSADCDIDSFKAVVEVEVDLSQYPRASGVAEGAVVYEAASLGAMAVDAAEPLMAELAGVLSAGPGIAIFRGGFDEATVDAATDAGDFTEVSGVAAAVHEPDREVAIVPLGGAGQAIVDGETFELSRKSVFEQMPHVLYIPPGHQVEITGNDEFEVSVGSAPAEGKYPVRLFRPDEMKSELRGGGASYRHVNHVLAPPLPAERLIMYEVYVPRGTWSGWAPHCHDGYDGSPYLEETYYFRLDPAEGFAMHRNWRVDEPFDETFVAGDKDCVTVRKGYHSSVACPSSHMFFLNYLAGDLYDEDRVTPPCFHSDFTWIQDDWDAGAWDLPVVRP